MKKGHAHPFKQHKKKPTEHVKKTGTKYLKLLKKKKEMMLVQGPTTWTASGATSPTGTKKVSSPGYVPENTGNRRRVGAGFHASSKSRRRTAMGLRGKAASKTKSVFSKNGMPKHGPTVKMPHAFKAHGRAKGTQTRIYGAKMRGEEIKTPFMGKSKGEIPKKAAPLAASGTINHAAAKAGAKVVDKVKGKKFTKKQMKKFDKKLYQIRKEAGGVMKKGHAHPFKQHKKKPTEHVKKTGTKYLKYLKKKVLKKKKEMMLVQGPTTWTASGATSPT